jgi:hypothetical protein
MNAAEAYARLLSLGLPVLRTSEAATVLRLSPMAAAQALKRLSQAKLVKPLRQGQVWVPSDAIDPWVALEFLSAPYPAYGSLYSALYLRGALSQLPQTYYAVTLGRTRRFPTSVGTYSLHRIVPELFGGFETLASGAKMATVEKALFDLAYLSSARSRLFSRPPEIELPSRFDRAQLRGWLAKIQFSRRRVQVEAQLRMLLKRAGRRL